MQKVYVSMSVRKNEHTVNTLTILRDRNQLRSSAYFKATENVSRQQIITAILRNVILPEFTVLRKTKTFEDLRMPCKVTRVHLPTKHADF